MKGTAIVFCFLLPQYLCLYLYLYIYTVYIYIIIYIYIYIHIYIYISFLLCPNALCWCAHMSVTLSSFSSWKCYYLLFISTCARTFFEWDHEPSRVSKSTYIYMYYIIFICFNVQRPIPPILGSNTISSGQLGACSRWNPSLASQLPFGKHTKNIKKLWNIIIFHGTINYFYGNFQ